MHGKTTLRYIIRLGLAFSLPVLIFIVSLFVPFRAYASGVVTDCSSEADLRAKLTGGGLVTFNCGLAPVTISLTTTDIAGSHLTITETTTIRGGGLITLQGNGSARILNVDNNTLILDGLTLSNGRALTSSPNDAGGALRIVNSSVVTIAESTLSNNQADFLGGAIFADNSKLNIRHSSLFDNQARFGGAIYIRTLSNPGSMAKATIINSAIISNTATDGDGGAIRTFDTELTIVNSTLSNNRALEVSGGLPGGDGGGISVSGSIGSSITLITNTTIYSNFASINGGGIQADSGSGNVKNTIVARNVATTTNVANCSSASLLSNGNNIDSGNGCNFSAGSDLPNTDPLLGPLANNGGNTFTHAPLPGSPAINTADNTACAAAPVSNVDQRGVLRPQGVTCDIGAVEATAGLSLSKSSFNQGGDPVQPGERITYTISITNIGTLTVTGGVISDSVPVHTSFVPGSIKLEPTGAGVEGVDPPTLVSGLTITANESVTVSYAVVLNTPLPNQTQIVNTASVTSNEVSLTQSSSVTDTVVSTPTLSIEKSSLDANGGLLTPGDTLTYTIIIRNNGTANATGGVISDSLPANTSFVPGSIVLKPLGAGPIGSAPPALASGLTITANQGLTLTYAVVVDSPLPDQTKIVNTASVTSNEVSLPQTSTVTDTVSSLEVYYLPVIHKNSVP
jgi:uncharacterized repeat protein (TIGR01451 family)